MDSSSESYSSSHPPTFIKQNQNAKRKEEGRLRAPKDPWAQTFSHQQRYVAALLHPSFQSLQVVWQPPLGSLERRVLLPLR